MGDLALSLPVYFGFKGQRAVKERGSFLLNAESGPVKIYKAAGGTREIAARYELFRRLAEAGFSDTDGLLPAASGAPYVMLGREIFIMSRHIPGREPDFDKFSDVKLLIEILARFHSAARGFVAEIPTALPLSDVFTKQISALSSAVKQVNRSKGLSDFDVLMLKHADSYALRATEALGVLQQTDYVSLHDTAVAENHICHNGLKEESLPILGESCYITRFDDAEINTQLNDLASLIRRYARKSYCEIPIDRFLEIYDKILPLPKTAPKIIYAMLSFPWPFMKLVSRFYSKKRNFTPAAITSRMADILAEQENYDEYLETISSTERNP
ncbi:MAG: hypothetical protein FWF79_10075 [Defluviitaleaceae bacterium]|nr:hypothetical protein [Defluviitaleaceae bacterium]